MKLTKNMIKEFESNQQADGTKKALQLFMDARSEFIMEEIENSVQDVLWKETLIDD